jgi:hypothetical protein
MSIPRKESKLFTMDLMLMLGAPNNDETRHNISEFNGLTRFWKRENMANFEKFINLVKSRVDPLAVAIDNSEPTADDKKKIQELGTRLAQSEQKLAKSQEAARILHAKYTELKQRGLVSQDDVLKNVINSYNMKCKELVSIRDELDRCSMLYGERIRATVVMKNEMDKKSTIMNAEIQELRKSANHEIDPAAVYETQAEERMRKLVPVSAYAKQNRLRLTRFIPQGMLPNSCPIPTRDGKLVPLKAVYISWKKDGCTLDDEFPPFKVHNDAYALLADANQIALVHTILSGFVGSLEPPFKIQFKKGEDWFDIAFIDQIRIVAVMFGMMWKKSSKERRIIQSNTLMIMINLNQRLFTFGMITMPDMEETGVRLIMVDESFDFL